MDSVTLVHIVYACASVVVVAVGSVFTSIAQGRVVCSALESIARQPEAAGDLRFTMIIGLAMIESLAIYCLLISLALLFVRW
jgi:F-type H+-transporting ATPase subunit c